MKSIPARLLCAMVFAVLAFIGTAHAQDAQPGDDFLKLVDARKYGESWDLSSEYLKQSVSRDEWATQMVKVRETIGDLASRKLKSSVPRKDPAGAPPGDYLLQTYESVFASQGAPKTETLSLIKGADGKWRAIGYFIR
jgi:hypothetical protein